MAKKKKSSWTSEALKFGAVAVGGAVIGAYGLRIIDNYFETKYGRKPFTGNEDDGSAGELEGEVATANPRQAGASAIAPVVPLFGMQTQVMPPPSLYIAGSGRAAVPSSVPQTVHSFDGSAAIDALPNRAGPSAEEVLEKRNRDFEELARKFEEGEL